MLRQLQTLLITFVFAAPGSLQAQQSQVDVDHPGLRLMNAGEFNLFLKRLDTDVVRWKAWLKTVNIASLGLGLQEGREIKRSHDLGLRALDVTRADIQKLSEKQTLKVDVLLLMDLGRLARNLDRLSSNLANPITVQETSTAKRSLGWAREVLRIDEALASHMAEFQQHVVALAAFLEATLEGVGQNGDQSQEHK
jgi:hypothetical protein